MSEPLGNETKRLFFSFTQFGDAVSDDVATYTTDKSTGSTIAEWKNWFQIRSFHGILLEKFKLPFTVRKGDGLTLSDISPERSVE